MTHHCDTRRLNLAPVSRLPSPVSRLPSPVSRLPSPASLNLDADLLRIPIGPGALHVARYGHGGSPIVLLHGFGTSSFLWRAVAPLLVEEGFTAYALDLLGHGESDRPYDADYGIAAQADYLDRALTSLRLSRAALVGVDLGGAVALRLAALRPERVEHLVLVNPFALDCVPGDDVKRLQRSTARVAMQLARGILGAAALLGPLLTDSVSSPDLMPMRLQARYLAPFVGKDGITHLLHLARAIREEDLETIELRAIRAPTLVIWGEAEKSLDEKLPDRLVNALPASTLERLPGVARLVPEEAPERLAALVLNFIAHAARV